MLARLLTRLLPRRFGLGPTRFKDVYALYERGALARADRAAAAIGDATRPDVEFLQGLIARKRGEPVRAAVCMGAAVEARPFEPAFRVALGEVLRGLKRPADALEHFDAFLASGPPDAAARASALLDAGRCCVELGDSARACRYFEQALEIEPGNGDLRDALSTAMFKEARVDEARSTLAPLVSAGVAGMRLRRALFLPPVYDSGAHIDAVRERFELELDEVLASNEAPVEDPSTQVGVTAFHLAYHNRNNAPLLGKLCRAMRHVYPDRPVDALRKPRHGGRLRVGFVSTFFRLHSVARTTLGLIRDLPRDRFSVHVFAVTPHDDAMRAAIEAAADHYVKLPHDLAEVRRAVEAAALDVLIFADIGMDPITYGLALSRLAPVQAVSWGHSDTSGVDTVDYYLSADGVELADAQAHYTERLVRPPAFFLPGYERPVLEQPLSREALGLPSNVRLYACLQPVFKLHPDIDAVFAALLERDPQGEIVLLESNAAAAALVRRRFARTLGTSASRVRFIPGMSMQRYLATLKAVDVALDPLYFGGCNSSCEMMALGVPLVTLPGDHLYGRFTVGLYREMGIDRCIARSVEDYVDIACRIAADRDLRHEIGREIEQRSHVVFDRKDITLAYADFFEEAVAARG